MNTPEFTHTTYIVPSEVDEHMMLRQFLFIRHELALKPAVLICRSSALACAGNRKHFYMMTLNTHEYFRRRADQLHRIEVHKEEIGRRIDKAQRTIDGERIAGILHRHFARQHGLKNVAFMNIMLRPFDDTAKPLFVAGSRIGNITFKSFGGLNITVHMRHHFLYLPAALVVLHPQIFFGIEDDIMNQCNQMFPMVEFYNRSK